MKKLYLLGVVWLVALTISCTSTINLGGVTSCHSRGDYGGAYVELLGLEEKFLEKQGPLLYALDLGALAHYNRQWLTSNNLLDRAELQIWENYSESITANLGSYLVNDNTRAYQGEDFEDLYTNIFKALNYLHLGEGEGSLVELRRLSEKQQMLRQKYEMLDQRLEMSSHGDYVESYSSSQFSSSALGYYLQMIVARDMGEFNDALFAQGAVQRAFKSQPALYPFSLPKTVEEDLNRLKEGSKRVNLIAFSGLAPYKVEVVERFPLSSTNWVKIALPQMVRRPSLVNSIEVVLSNGSRFNLELMENIGEIAIEAFRLRERHIYNKTIIRALLKATGTEIIDYATETMASEAESQEAADAIIVVGSILSLFSRIFSEASENADVRGSHFFPDKAWVGGIDLPYGNYEAHLYYRNSSGKVIYEESLQGINVASKGLTIWEGVCPY
ncbi:MAG: hypothetical protein GX842_07180 [Spirochaetales bacterium]|nr:hypothetical protein [Spirochaetales bacterium]